MSKREAFQTLEHRDIEKVEANGPFLCDKSNAWLGTGYYFWDSFIENAHWWGNEVANYSKGYIICKSTVVLDNRCFDLYDNPDHLRTFTQLKKIMEKMGLIEANKTTVARILNFIKDTLDIFPFEAIRAYGVNSKGYKSSFNHRTKFEYKENRETKQYLDAMPAIQICLFTKDSLDREGFTLVFPVEYSKEYVI